VLGIKSGAGLDDLEVPLVVVKAEVLPVNVPVPADVVTVPAISITAAPVAVVKPVLFNPLEDDSDSDNSSYDIFSGIDLSAAFQSDADTEADFSNATCNIDIAYNALDKSLEAQTVESLSDPKYWLSICPFLHCGSTTSTKCPPPSSADSANLRANLLSRGYFSIHPEPFPNSLIDRLALGVETLIEHGHPPSSISMYDEAWELADSLKPLITEVTGNAPLGDW
jgi:hypothetical protein